MSGRPRQRISTLDALPPPLGPITMRNPVAVQPAGIGRSKIYELDFIGGIETLTVGASTMIHYVSRKRPIVKVSVVR